MADDNGGAQAPADAGGVPIVDHAPQTPGLGSQAPVAEKPAAETPAKDAGKDTAVKKDEPSKSSGEAIRKAFDKLNAKDTDTPVAKDTKDAKPAAVKAETKPIADAPTRERAPDGKFAPKEGSEPQATQAAPQQTAQAAKVPGYLKTQAERDDYATWSDTAKSVSERREAEYEAGISKYRGDAERAKNYAPFEEMAKPTGKDAHVIFGEYVNMEKLLRSDPVKGLEEVCSRMGYSLRDVAAHVMGQTPDQQASQSDATIRELKQELASIKQQVGGVTQNIQQQRESSTLAEINKFAEQNPRFEELSEDIAFFMKSGRAKDLSEAYGLAERLNPAPTPASSPAAPSQARAAADPQIHNLRGQKSISGAPADGSDPGQQKPAASTRQALQRAFARVS